MRSGDTKAGTSPTCWPSTAVAIHTEGANLVEHVTPAIVQYLPNCPPRFRSQGDRRTSLDLFDIQNPRELPGFLNSSGRHGFRT